MLETSEGEIFDQHAVLDKKISPGGLLAITRDAGHLQVPGLVEMVPTSLPELPKPSRTLGEKLTS